MMYLCLVGRGGREERVASLWTTATKYARHPPLPSVVRSLLMDALREYSPSQPPLSGIFSVLLAVTARMEAKMQGRGGGGG